MAIAVSGEERALRVREVEQRRNETRDQNCAAMEKTGRELDR